MSSVGLCAGWAPSEQVRHLGVDVPVNIHAVEFEVAEAAAKGSEMWGAEVLGKRLLGIPFLEDPEPTSDVRVSPETVCPATRFLQ